MDEREPAFHARVAAAARGGETAPLKVLARRFGSAAPFAGGVDVQREDGASGWRTGEVLLELRFAAAAGGVIVFLEEARARGGIELPTGADAAATQRAVFEISRATHEAPTLAALFERIHGIVERLIGAKNFYIALVDEEDQMLRFPYARDEFEVPRDRTLGLGVTDLVYQTGQALLLDRAAANRMLEEGAVVNYGVPAQVWLGVPLKVAGRTVGAMAVQDYHNPHFLGEAERQILGYISDQIANAIAIRRAEDVASVAKAEAERASRVKADFLAVMSHELRTPLTAVIGFSDLLQETLGGTAEGKQAASIGFAGQRLLAAINQMLDYARVDALAQPVNEETVDLKELLTICEGFCSARMREKNLTFTIRREGFVPDCVRTDGELLKQILLQLLDNAVKFTSTGGRIRVLVRAEPVAPRQANRHRCEFTIEDDGVGIAPELMPRLFEPFEPGQRPGRTRGPGLGLAISSRLATLLGGKITVRSTPGEGSVFTLRFTAEATTPAGLSALEPDATERLELRLRSRLAATPWPVLIMDGNADSRAILAALVERVSEQAPLVAADADTALALWEKERPRLVLIDSPQADESSVALCRTLRERAGAGPAPHIVALSVDHSPALVQRCLAAGADHYLPKPVSRHALVDVWLVAMG
jgi:signal transduction histidine kinase/CheY-like chemotaxis protein